MSLKLYRIDRSFFGKLNNRLKQPDIPVAASIIGNPFKNLVDFNRENSYVLSKDDEISRFTEAYNNDWVDDIYYIRHPKKCKTDILIPAERFHQYIIREQISDMISYLRANLRVKELEINILRNNSGKLGLNGVIEGLDLEGEANIKFNKSYSAIIQCPRPLKASEKKKNYTWIDEFPHVVEIVDDVEDGKFKINEEFDLSFGLSVKVAKVIGANIEWNTNHTFNLEVTAG